MSRRIFDLLCIPVIERTAPEAMMAAKAASRHARWIEFRLDYLCSAAEIHRLQKRLQEAHFHGNHLIFTLRRRDAGGRFKGSPGAQWRCLQRFASLRQWIDLEIETIDALGHDCLISVCEAGSRSIVSYHNFRHTPPHLLSIARRLQGYPADIIKIATQANSLTDAARLLDLQGHLHRKKASSVVLGMGAAGFLTRLLGASRGGEFTFAVLTSGRESAPGQCSVLDLKRRFRIGRINPATRIFGILGRPLGHSLSPALYNAAFSRLRLNAAYVTFESATIADFPRWTRELKVAGLSVTIPYKSSVMKYLHRVDPLAMKIGAVNTILFKSNRCLGYNTDVLGIRETLRKHHFKLRGATVLLLGAGGAARAAAALLAREGSSVTICNRTHRSAITLAREFGQQAAPLARLKGHHFDLVMNATSVGMWPRSKETPLDLSSVSADVVFDMVYNPLETRLLREAKLKGLRTISGLDMFQGQAEAQFKLLTGRKLPHAVWAEVSGNSSS